MITPLPDPPSRADPSTFADKGDAFLAALPTFAAELNAAGSTFALGVSGTSTTSLAIGTGSKSLTTQSGRGFVAGMDIKISSAADVDNYMLGSVASYNAETGALVATITSIGGSGTYADWSITFAAAVPGMVDLTSSQTLTNKTLDAVNLTNGYTEEVFAVTGTTPALSPTNGSIQTWTLSSSSTPTAGTWADGQSITLMVNDGTDYTITWTSLAVTWKTDSGSAPTLNTSGYTVIVLWKVGATIYGARVGNA